MSERVLKCPHCNAPLPPSRFARAVTCSFCGASVQVDPSAVFAAKYRRAYQDWNQQSPWSDGVRTTVGDSHWRLGAQLAHGEVSDVFFAERDRWPTERALFKVLRDPQDLPLLEAEHAVLQALHTGTPGGHLLSARVPQPVAFGKVSAGPHASRHALGLRWAPGFRHTFEALRRAHPNGIEPRASIWVWRRMLETLGFLHQAGFAHGAVLPPHLLAEDGEHGVRLVGYSCAGPVGTPLRAVFSRWAAFYPEAFLGAQALSPLHDVVMSARCVAYLLGGAPDGSRLPEQVPGLLGEKLRAAAEGRASRAMEAWTLHEQLGTLGTQLYGPPAFVPITLPD